MILIQTSTQPHSSPGIREFRRRPWRCRVLYSAAPSGVDAALAELVTVRS